MEIRSDSKTLVDWIRGKARLGNVTWASVWNVQQQFQGMVNHDHQVEEKQNGGAIHIFPEHKKEADAQGGKINWNSGGGMGGQGGLRLV